MAVLFDAASTVNSGSSFVSTLDLTTLTVGSGSNRALVSCLHTNASSLPTGITATWDQGGTNQGMTAITSASAANGSGGTIQMFGLVAPTSGNKTLRISWTSATARSAVGAASFTGADQTGGNTTFPHGAGSTGTSLNPSITVTSAANNIAFGAYTQIGTTTIDSVDNTQAYRDNSGNCCNAANYANGAASVTLTATLAKSKVWASAGTDILAAATAFTWLSMVQTVDGSPARFRNHDMVGYE